MKPKVLAISGSLNPSSRTCSIAEQALELARVKGAETELIDLRKFELPFYDDRDDTASYGANVLALNAKVKAADIVILASPVYHGVMSGVLKNALDHLVTEVWFKGKVVGLISVAGGMAGINAINSMQFTVQALEGFSIPTTLAVPGAVIEADGRIKDPRMLKRMDKMLVDLLDFSRALKR